MCRSAFGTKRLRLGCQLRLDSGPTIELTFVAWLPWPHFGHTRTLNAAAYYALVSTVWAGQQWNGQVAGARNTVYGSALGTAGAAPYRPEKWLRYRPLRRFHLGAVEAADQPDAGNRFSQGPFIVATSTRVRFSARPPVPRAVPPRRLASARKAEVRDAWKM